SLIKTIVQDIVENGDSSALKQNTKSNHSQHQYNTTGLTDSVLSDISDVQIKKDLLVPNPQEKGAYLEMKSNTPARIGVWHAGSRYLSSTSLRFKADHAAAQDAVFSYVNEDFIEKNNLFSTG